MDGILAELEQAATLQSTAVKLEDRRSAEKTILRFRSQEQPYNLCLFILTQSSNDLLLYEAGRCLSHAISREWNLVFAADNDHSKAAQLLNFILEWAESRGNQFSAAARQRVLGAAGALVKRAAAAHAERATTAWFSGAAVENNGVDRNSNHFYRSRFLINTPEDPGPPCPLLITLIEHIESLVGLLLHPSELSQKSIKDSLLGLRILNALLDEFAYTEDTTQLDLPLEAHIFLRTRFQDFELLRLFRTLLHIVDQVIHGWTSELPSLDTEQNEIVFRLVGCLEKIVFWDFLPRELIGFYATRLKRSESETRFRPSLKWADVVGPEVLPNVLALFFKLHTWIRKCDILGSKTLSCLVRLSTISGPLVDPPTSLIDLSASSSNGTLTSDDPAQSASLASTMHLSFMENLNCWLTGSIDAASNSTSFFTVACQIPGLKEECSRRFTNSSSLPHVPPNTLEPYELPILSDLIQNLVLRCSRLWGPVEMFLVSQTPRNRLENITQSSFQNALLTLLVVDRFLSSMCGLLVQCLKFLACNKSGPDGVGQLAHEAVERLFNCWSDMVDLIPSSIKFSNDASSGGNFSNDENVPLPLTTGQFVDADVLTVQLTKLLRLLKSGVSRHQVNLFQSYVLSKLAAPDGLRQSIEEDDDFDFDIDEDDLTVCEDSLFSVGLCGLGAPEDTISVLHRAFEERISKLLITDNSSTAPINLLEDLHWLILITGHFLVSGPASLSGIMRNNSPWDTEFSIPEQLLRLYSGSSFDIAASRRLITLTSSQPWGRDSIWPPQDIPFDHVPSLVKLICSVFRLLWLQSSTGLGSAQLVEDNFWLMTRLAVTFFRQNLDRDVLTTISQSPILTILHTVQSDPPHAHQNPLISLSSSRSITTLEHVSNIGKSESEFSDVTRTCIHGLLTCARMALDMWSSERQVLSSLTRLLNVLSRYAPNPSVSIVCPAWYDICTVVCGPEAPTCAWPNLTSNSLIELVEACLCGSYAIDRVHIRSILTDCSLTNSGDTLLLQLLRSIREHMVNILTLSSSSIGDKMESIVNCASVMRGVARAAGQIASSCESTTDFISLVWSGLLSTMLEQSANNLVMKCHNCTEVIQGLVALYSEVADSCLIYLASLSSSSPTNHTNGEQTPACFASHLFLDWTVTLCRQYSKYNSNKVSSETCAEDNRVEELRLLLTLLNGVLSHEFDLHFSTAIILSGDDEVENKQASGVQAVDAVLIGLGYLLQLITDSTLTRPELCHAFFSLASCACELRSKALTHLSDSQLSYFGHLLRVGIFGLQALNPQLSSGPVGSIDNSVTQQCLEVVISLTDYYLELRAQKKPEFSATARVLSLMGLGTQLLSDLFTFLTHETYAVDLEPVFSSAVLNLIHLNPSDYANLVHQWISKCEDTAMQKRLSSAFEQLACPTEQSVDANAPNRYTLAFDELKPSRIVRLDFQQRFHYFAAEVRSFVCRG